MSARLVLSVAALLVLASCAPSHERAPDHKDRVAVTPNGEPLPQVAGPDGCREALAGWFARADTNNDGVLSLDEMLADGERWFAMADLDHNGEITADELTTVRLRINPLPDLGPLDARRDDDGPGGGPRVPMRSRSQVDPVMAADANADFRVTKAEFRALVTTRTQARPQGVLTADQVQESCRSSGR